MTHDDTAVGLSLERLLTQVAFYSKSYVQGWVPGPVSEIIELTARHKLSATNLSDPLMEVKMVPV